jgi:hypothetical protein
MKQIEIFAILGGLGFILAGAYTIHPGLFFIGLGSLILILAGA